MQGNRGKIRKRTVVGQCTKINRKKLRRFLNIPEIQSMWIVKAKNYSSNNRGEWHLFKITHKIPQQHNMEARN
jgi:hypothetical protein